MENKIMLIHTLAFLLIHKFFLMLETMWHSVENILWIAIRDAFIAPIFNAIFLTLDSKIVQCYTLLYNTRMS